MNTGNETRLVSGLYKLQLGCPVTSSTVLVFCMNADTLVGHHSRIHRSRPWPDGISESDVDGLDTMSIWRYIFMIITILVYYCLTQSAGTHATMVAWVTTCLIKTWATMISGCPVMPGYQMVSLSLTELGKNTLNNFL